MGRRLISALLVVATAGACTSGADAEPIQGPAPAPDAAPVQRADRPDGPIAELSGPMAGGDGISLGAAVPGPDLDEAGWVEEEYVAEGVATSYRPRGSLPSDGAYRLVENAADRYRTRILVRRPRDAEDFNGTVVVEWLNVSAGFDTSPVYAYAADELVRGGYAWVGVSAQHLGIEGGPVTVGIAGTGDVAGTGLRRLDPERYGTLTHPGDAYAYDIYTQVARALRAPGDGDALGGLEPERLLAVGDSQSAFALTTYVDGVQPLTLAFDGFLLLSRGGAAAPLGQPDTGIDIADSIAGEPTRLRTDGEAPILVLESESDVLSILNYHPARQPDSSHFRLWEVAGTAHADAALLGLRAARGTCPAPARRGPLHLVAKAALRGLDTWVRTGDAPPRAPRLETDATPAFVRDRDGNVLGGVRTPQVDVPVATLSSEPSATSSVMCVLLGSTRPFSPERLRQLYPTVDAYVAAYTRAVDAAIDAGFALPEDRPALLADAQPGVIPVEPPAAT